LKGNDIVNAILSFVLGIYKSILGIYKFQVIT